MLLEIGICDDQQEWADKLYKLLHSYLKKKGIDAQILVFTSGEDLLASDWQSLQILFLDVVMDKQDGVQVAAQIRNKNPDISLLFVSAFLDYATMGYQVKANAYLLKSQLECSLDRAMDSVLMERKLNQGVIEISVDGHTVALPLHEITYIESRGRNAVFYGKSEYQTCMRLGDIESILSGKGFLRIHRCYIINLAHCITIKNYEAVLDSNKNLPCSRKEYSNLVRSMLRWKGIHQ